MASDLNGYEFAVFLSHSSPDKGDIRKIFERLRDDYSIKAFFDADSLLAGKNFDQQISEKISKSACGAFFYGGSEPGGYFQREIAMWQQEGAHRNFDEFLIPVLLPSVTDQRINSIDGLLTRLTRIDLRKDLFEKEEFEKFVRMIQLATTRHAGVIDTTGAQAKLAARPQLAPAPLDLAILCDRTEQTGPVEAAFERDQQDQHRPIIVVITGTDRQKPNSFVDRILKDTLPSYLRGNTPCVPRKIIHDPIQPSRAVQAENSDGLQQTTRGWVKALYSSSILGNQHFTLVDFLSWPLREVVQRINEAGAVVFQSTIPASKDHAATRRAVSRLLDFYSQSEFQELRHPLIVGVCVIPVEPEQPAVRRGIWQKLFGGDTRVATEALDLSDLSQKYQSSLMVVQPPSLGDVEVDEVRSWIENPRVTDFCPGFAHQNFDELLFGKWQQRFGKRSAPMADAIADLSRLLSTCCQPSTKGGE